MIVFRKPCWLPIPPGNLTQGTHTTGENLLVLVRNDSDLQASILGSLKDFVPMKAEEDVRGVLAS